MDVTAKKRKINVGKERPIYIYATGVTNQTAAVAIISFNGIVRLIV
jgi:hypothetical protein